MQFATRLRQERVRRHLSQEALAEALGVSPRSIVRWEQSQVVPQASVRLQLLHFFGLRSEELFPEAEVQALPPLLWTVPYPRNPCFTGRETILSLVQTHLASSQPIALSGLGGIGKTQIAVEYAYRYAQEYCAIFWLAAETAESLMASLHQIANRLQLPECQAVEQSQMVAAVLGWLATHAGWLLIGDNLEDLDLLQTMLPLARHGSLLFTTRRQALGALAEALEIPPMSNEEGARLLLRRTRRLHDTSLPAQEPRDASPALVTTELVTLLEGLPLALDQAGAYIEETGCSIADYVQRYHDHRQHMLARRGSHGGAHPASVSTTLVLAIEQVRQGYAAAIDLLQACSLLHAEAIPEELLAAGAPHLGSVLGALVADAYQFDLALAALRNASLMTRRPETRTLSVHRLVQAVLQDQMEPDESDEWSKRVIGMVNAVFPEVSVETWHQSERYITHALACVAHMGQTHQALPEMGELLYKTGSYLVERGRYGEAEPLLEQAVMQAEWLHGPDHPVLIPRLEKQAELCWRLEKYEPTEGLLRRVLELENRHLGETHPRTAETQNNLATLYYKQSKYEQAEALYQHALRVEEQELGADHPEIATTLNNLALLYRRQEKYEQAEALYQRSLNIRVQHLGAEHPETAISFHNLASLYQEQKHYERAELLYQNALRIREQHYGSEHPETAVTMARLAALYQKQGKDEQAEALFQHALGVQEQRLGSAHPETVKLRHEYDRLLAQRRAARAGRGEP